MTSYCRSIRFYHYIRLEVVAGRKATHSPTELNSPGRRDVRHNTWWRRRSSPLIRHQLMPRPHNYYLRTAFMDDDEEEFYDEYPQVDEVMGSVTIENFGGGDEDAVAWLGKYRSTVCNFHEPYSRKTNSWLPAALIWYSIPMV